MGAIQKLKRDHFRAKAYDQAARVLRNHPSAILNGAQAKALAGIGDGMARRIDVVLAGIFNPIPKSVCFHAETIPFSLW